MGMHYNRIVLMLTPHCYISYISDAKQTRFGTNWGAAKRQVGAAFNGAKEPAINVDQLTLKLILIFLFLGSFQF